MFLRRAVAVASACFVLSGAAALVYQVAWLRLLALTTGVSVPSGAAITAAHECPAQTTPVSQFASEATD